jgi:iron(III) transport system substrate-binding protein
MKKTMLALLGGLLVSLCVAMPAIADQKLLVYTSMRESLIGDLKTAFSRTHPDIDIDFQSAGAGKLMAKISAEQDSGTILADVLWTGEVPDFYRLKGQGMLQPYVPAELKSVINPFKDYDGSFTAVRLGTLGIVYNTRFVKDAPKSWHDAHKPIFKGAFAVANPALSGSAYMSVALLVKAFGWAYFEALQANGVKIGKGSGPMVEEAASGDLLACLAADHVAFDKIDKGASLAMVYPPEMLVIPSPIAILKGAPNAEAARQFVDFVLSKEGQTIIANEGMLPVRSDVAVPERFNLPTPADAMKRAIKIDYLQLIAERDATVKRFSEIMQKEAVDKR